MDALKTQINPIITAIKKNARLTPSAFCQQLEPIFQQHGYRNASPDTAIRNILVVRQDRIGDFILMSPFLRELRRHFPTARITLIVNQNLYNLAELCPYVNEVLSLPLRDNISLEQLTMLTDFAALHLWQHHFDLALCPRCGPSVYVDSFVAYLSGSRERIGFSANILGNMSLADKKYEPFNIFLTKTMQITAQPLQELEHNLQILQLIGITPQDKRLEVWYETTDIRAIASKMKDFANGKRIITVSMGASEPRKTYPKEKLLAALKVLWQKDQTAFLLLGGPADRATGDFIASQLPAEAVRNLAGQTTLRETAAAIAKTGLYIGNDTGMLHIAAAQHLPIIEISCDLPVAANVQFLRLPVRFAPWQTPYILLHPSKPLSPCDQHRSPIGCMEPTAHCITQIQPEEIIQAAHHLLALNLTGYPTAAISIK